jgi:hypothetical protein
MNYFNFIPSTLHMVIYLELLRKMSMSFLQTLCNKNRSSSFPIVINLNVRLGYRSEQVIGSSCDCPVQYEACVILINTYILLHATSRYYG